MQKKDIISKIEMLEAIPGSKGLILNIEKKLNCTRDAVKNALRSFPEVKKEMEDEAEREKDIVMNNLIEDAKNGDKAARDLYLKSLAKDRGFGEKTDTNSGKGKPLVYLHASMRNIAPLEINRQAAKSDRISNWAKSANEYHEKQVRELRGKTVDEIFAQ